MAADAHVKQAEDMLRQFTTNLPACGSIGEALTDVGETWWRAWARGLPILQTDYQRARRRTLAHCRQTLGQLHDLRRSSSHAALIHACDHVRRIQRTCRRCPKVNREQIAKGGAFACQLTGPTPARDTPFRFNLNAKGDIVDDG